MSGTPNTLAVRNGTVAAQQPGAALELRSGQTMWTRDQHAALVAMGIPKEATSAELGVFLHQCQRTGLDPFSKQIYLIYRPGYENGRPVSKPTTQVGIDGFRVIRDRIARRDGLRVEYGDALWYAADGQAYDVWLWDEPPAACKFVVLVDGRRFSSTLRFGEYVQRKKDGAVNKMWTEKAAHMIEKCAEADALRRAFPNDMAGVILEDAVPLPEDAPEQRQRVTADQARQRNPQTVAAELVVTPEPSPAGTEATPDSGPPADVPAPAGEATRKPQAATTGQVGMIRNRFKELYPGEETDTERLERLAQTQLLAGREEPLGSTKELTAGQATRVLDALKRVDSAKALEVLIGSGEVTHAE